MKKVVKIIFSIPVIVFCLLALADVLSGGEPLIDEFIILFLGGLWFLYLKKPFKLPKFIIAFLVAIGCSVLHNIISHLLKVEEPVFFLATLISFAASVILLLIFLFKKIKSKFSK